MALRIARREGDPTLAAIVMAGVVAKLLAALVRYYIAYVVYNGVSDATQYDVSGRLLAPDFRRLIFSLDKLPERKTLVGTNFARVVTGADYAIFGAGKIAGFLVFSWLAFVGLYLFARAFRVGVPEGDGRRYLILVLFLPSLLYWPSAIGKEAWMILGLGLCAYGIACLFQRRSTGVLALVPGLFAVLMMRPHLSLVLFVGLVFALLVRKAPARSYAAPLFRMLGLGALLVLGVFLAGQTASFLGQESLTTESVGVELSATQEQTGEGGSSFSPVRVNTPIDLVPAFATVFFRPFVFEAGNLQGLLTAAEGVLLFVLAVASSPPTQIDPAPDTDDTLRRVQHRVRARVHVRVLELRQLRHPRPPAVPGAAPSAGAVGAAVVPKDDRTGRIFEDVEPRAPTHVRHAAPAPTSTSRSAASRRRTVGPRPAPEATGGLIRTSTSVSPPRPKNATGAAPDPNPVVAAICCRPSRRERSPSPPARYTSTTAPAPAAPAATELHAQPMSAAAVVSQQQRRARRIELDDEHVEITVVVGVDGGTRDPVLLRPRAVGSLEPGHATLGAAVAEHRRAGAAVGRGRREDVGPPVVVEIDDLDVRRLRRQPDDPGLLCHVAKARDSVFVVPLVEVQPDGNQLPVIDRAVVVLTDEEIDASVTVDVTGRDARRVIFLSEALPLERRGVCFPERSMAVVDEQPIRVADEEVGPTVTVEVGRTDTESRDPRGQTGAGGRVLEAQAALVVEEHARSGTTEVILDQEEVETAVAVVVEDPDRSAASLRVEHGGLREPPGVVAEHQGRRPAAWFVTNIPREHEVEIAVAIKVCERGAGRAAGADGERLVDRETVGAAEQQAVGGPPTLGLERLVGEPTKEEVGPPITVDVADRGRVAVPAAQWLPDPGLIGDVGEPDRIDT